MHLHIDSMTSNLCAEHSFLRLQGIKLNLRFIRVFLCLIIADFLRLDTACIKNEGTDYTLPCWIEGSCHHGVAFLVPCRCFVYGLHQNVNIEIAVWKNSVESNFIIIIDAYPSSFRHTLAVKDFEITKGTHHVHTHNAQNS